MNSKIRSFVEFAPQTSFCFPFQEKTTPFLVIQIKITAVIFFLSLLVSSSSLNPIGSIFKVYPEAKHFSHFHGTILVHESTFSHLDYSNILLNGPPASVFAPTKCALHIRVIFSKPEVNHCLPLHKILYIPSSKLQVLNIVTPFTRELISPLSLLTLFQPLRSPSCFFSMNTRELLLRDLCTCYSLCLEYSSPRYLQGSLLLPSDLYSNITLPEMPVLTTLHKIAPPSTLYALYPDLFVFIALSTT